MHRASAFDYELERRRRRTQSCPVAYRVLEQGIHISDSDLEPRGPCRDILRHPSQAIQRQETSLFQLSVLQPRWIMFICRIFSFVSLYTGAVLAKPLRIVNENTLSPSVSNIVDAAFGLNVSTSTLAPANYNIECNGTLYGFNPNIADCENAAQSIMPDREQITWSERRPGSPGDFFSLPFAVFGGKW